MTDVLVSPSSVVTEMCEGVSLHSEWEFVWKVEGQKRRNTRKEYKKVVK